MAYLHRLIFCFLFLFSSGSHALSPAPTAEHCTRTARGLCSSELGWFPTLAAAQSAALSALDAFAPAQAPHSLCGANFCTSWGSVWFSQDAATRTVNACPASSTLTSPGVCTCDAGFIESGNQCIPDKPAKDPVCGPLADMSMGVSAVESDFGKQGTSWASSALGTSGKACIQGCQISGTIGGCVIGGSAICMVNDPKFTGEACDTKTEGNSNDGCPDGTILQPVSGLCVPKQNNCPAGQEPSKYVEGICIPQETANDGKCEDPSDPTKRVDCQGTDSKCPSGKVPSKVTPNTCVPALDGAEQSKNGNTYECTGGKCTVTKGDCTPSEGNTCKEEKTQGDACKEAPDLKQCKEDTGITGSCAGAFQCKGDGLQCAMALEQHKRNCELFEKQNDFSRLFDELKSAQSKEGTLQGTEVDLAGHFKVDSVIGNGVCPADITVMVMDRPIPVRLSDFCQYFNAMGYMLFLGACISCLRILGT